MVVQVCGSCGCWRLRTPRSRIAGGSFGSDLERLPIDPRLLLARTPMTALPVPFLDLVTPHRELEEELVDAFRRALSSAAFIGGPEVEAFEREFAEYCGSK